MLKHSNNLLLSFSYTSRKIQTLIKNWLDCHVNQLLLRGLHTIPFWTNAQRQPRQSLPRAWRVFIFRYDSLFAHN